MVHPWPLTHRRRSLYSLKFRLAFLRLHFGVTGIGCRDNNLLLWYIPTRRDQLKSSLLPPCSFERTSLFLTKMNAVMPRPTDSCRATSVSERRAHLDLFALCWSRFVGNPTKQWSMAKIAGDSKSPTLANAGGINIAPQSTHLERFLALAPFLLNVHESRHSERFLSERGVGSERNVSAC